MRYAIDLDAMLARCRRLQWSVDDLDWEAPGADAVSADQARDLAGFMTDLYWIEAIAARVFAAMQRHAGEPALAGIFASFSADEQRHADAELALMRRWGITGRNEIPAPNPNTRNLMRALDRVADRIHPAVYAAIIPFTELVLDGALVKHLDARVADPLCAQVFRKINADEARHLAVDFYLLERFGSERSPAANRLHLARAAAHPAVLYALLLGYLPMLGRMRPSIERIGLGAEQINACIRRYIALGDESPGAANHPTYALFRTLSRRMLAGKHDLTDALMRASDVCDALGLELAPARGAA